MNHEMKRVNLVRCSTIKTERIVTAPIKVSESANVLKRSGRGSTAIASQMEFGGVMNHRLQIITVNKTASVEWVNVSQRSAMI